MDFKTFLKPVLVALAAGSFTIAAVAQWQWIDKDGHKVFSDRSPSPDILEKNILKRPPGSARAAVQSSGTAASAEAGTEGIAAAAPKASAPKLSGRDTELEARKKKAESEETAKKKADEERQAAVKADNCTRAKTSMTTLQSGIRVSTMNANGEREIFDDAKRASETKRVQEIIDATCK